VPPVECDGQSSAATTTVAPVSGGTGMAEAAMVSVVMIATNRAMSESFSILVPPEAKMMGRCRGN